MSTCQTILMKDGIVWGCFALTAATPGMGLANGIGINIGIGFSIGFALALALTFVCMYRHQNLQWDFEVCLNGGCMVVPASGRGGHQRFPPRRCCECCGLSWIFSSFHVLNDHAMAYRYIDNTGMAYGIYLLQWSWVLAHRIEGWNP